MIKANFSAYASYVTDSLYQWDINQVLSVTGLNLTVAPEVHFSNANTDRAIVRRADMIDHVVKVGIPNSLLQEPFTIHAHVGIYEGSTFKVVERIEIPVIARKRPADYAITDADEEIYSFKALINRIANIIAANNNTAGNSELIDIRIGFDDTLYPSAGEAIREQIRKLSNSVDILNTGGLSLKDQAIAEQVAAWLDNHPEATTTVQNGAITSEKIADDYSLIKKTVTNAQTDGENNVFGHDSNAIADDVSTAVILGGGSTNYNNVIGGDGKNVGTTKKNTTVPGTGAHVSVVGGYDNSAGSLSSKIISDHSKTEVGGDGHNAIYGGANHIAKSSASFAMIAGGQSNTVGGYGSFATGVRNNSSGDISSTFGIDNECRAKGGFIAGAANVIKSLFCVCFGSENTVEESANFASVFGNFGIARFVGQHVFSTGKINKNGDAQTSIMTMHKRTTNGTGTPLGVLGSMSGYKLQPNQSAAFSTVVIGRDVNSTDCASFEIKGLATRGADGDSVIVNSEIVSTKASNGASAWRISAVNGASDGGVNVYVIGEENKTINWVMRMTLVEVTV